jgi:hypothetical protein
VQEDPSSSSSGAPPQTKAAAAASAAAAVYTVAAAMDVAALREEVARLAMQVQTLEQRQPTRLEELEAKVDELRRGLAVMKEQMHSQMRERQLEVIQEEQLRESRAPFPDSDSGMAAMRQELDDLRARWLQLSRQVESQCQVTTMCAAASSTSSDSFEAFRREQKAALAAAVEDLRRESAPAQDAAGELATDLTSVFQRPELLSLRRELFSELSTAVTNVRREVTKEMCEAAREVAVKTATEAATDAAHGAAERAAREAALRAANDTAREVAHVAAFEAVNATAEKAREAAREVGGEAAEAARSSIQAEASRLMDAQQELRAEVSALRADKSTPLLQHLNAMLRKLKADIDQRQDAVSSDMDMLQKEVREELSAAVAAMSKEVTTSCCEVGRSAACCQEDIQSRYAELTAMLNLQSSQFSSLRTQVEALRRDRTTVVQNEVIEARLEPEFKVDDAGPTKAQLCDVVTTLQQQLSSLRSKLQQVEGELWGDSLRPGMVRRSTSPSPAAFRSSEQDDAGQETLRQQRELEAQVRWLRTEASNTEPVLRSLKAECEDLRSALRQGLQRLYTTPAGADGQDVKSEVNTRVLSMAHVLGEEFDKVHAKKLADMVMVLGEEFDTVFQESDKANVDFADEFRQNFGQLSSIVQQLLQRQVNYASQLEAHQGQITAASPRNGGGPTVSAAAVPVVEEPPVELTSAKSTIQPIRIPDKSVSGGPSQHLQEKIASLPTEFEKFRVEHNGKLEVMAQALGEEFENTQNVFLENTLQESLQGIACALGEEFERVHNEKHRPLEGCVEELQQNQIKLAEFVDAMLAESGKAHVSLLDEFRQTCDKLSTQLEDLSRRHDAHSSEIEVLQQNRRCDRKDEIKEVVDKAQAGLDAGAASVMEVQAKVSSTASEDAKEANVNGSSAQEEPASKRALMALSDAPELFQQETDAITELALQLGRELENAGATCNMEGSASLRQLQEKLASLPQEVEALRKDHNEKLAALAGCLEGNTVQTQSMNLTSTMSHIACALGEEFDKVHAERSSSIEHCLVELQQNQDKLAAVVHDLQQRRENTEQGSNLVTDQGEANRELCVAEVESLLDANTEFVDELRGNFANLSTVVEDLLHRQISLASELEVVRRDCVSKPRMDTCIAASPEGSLQRSPTQQGVTSQESTSDSKRDPFGKSSPGMSDAPSALHREADAISNLASDLDCELSRVGVPDWDRPADRAVPHLPLHMDVLRNEHEQKLSAMATALGEEFEQIHVNQLSDMACALGEEFDRVHAEKHEPLRGCVIELQQNQERLAALMEGMLERQEFDKKYTDFLDEFKPQNFESVSGVIEKLLENQASIASELESLRQKSGTQPSAEVERQASMNTSVHEVEETALQEAQMLTGLANDLRNELEQKVNQPRMSSAVVTKIASLPAELDALRREQRELAEALAEEFENANATQLTDMACALGEEFDKLQGEKHQLLQGSLVELQQNQAKLAAIVLRQEYKASLSEFTEGESADKSKLPRSGAEYESLCCFVRAEIDQKLTALREQLSQQVLQTLEAPRAVDATVDAELATSKAAHAFNEEQLEQLFRITREQAALLEEIRQRQGQVQTLEAASSPFKSWRGDDRSPLMPLPTLSMFVEDEPASGEQTVEGALSVPDTATLSNRLPIVSFTDTSAWQDPVSALIPAQDRLAEQDSPLRAMATSQLPELRQQLALQQVMDDELRRARLALEGMPTFGAPEQFVPKVRAEPEAWEVPDTCAPGDIDSVPLSGRWFAAPAAAVPPGLRAQASEDVSPAAESPPASPSQATAPMPTAPDVPTTPPTTVDAASPASPAQAFAAASAATNEQTAAVTTASETSAVPVQQ